MNFSQFIGNKSAKLPNSQPNPPQNADFAMALLVQNRKPVLRSIHFRYCSSFCRELTLSSLPKPY